MTRIVAGVDAGVTSVKVAIVNDKGKLVSSGKGPGVNPYIIGLRKTSFRMIRTLEKLSRLDKLDFTTFGVTGMSTPGMIRELVRTLSTVPRIRNLRVVRDSDAALFGALLCEPGILVYAGTGSFAIGRNGRGKMHMSGGLGFLLSDEGGGFYIGHKALLAAVRELNGRGKRTCLTRMVLEHFGIRHFETLAAKLYTRPINPAKIATLAPAVIDSASRRDSVSSEIIQEATVELVKLVLAVKTRIFPKENSVKVATSGGVLLSPLVAKSFADELHSRIPNAELVKAQFPPAIGAALMSLNAVRRTLSSSKLRDMAQSIREVEYLSLSGSLN